MSLTFLLTRSLIYVISYIYNFLRLTSSILILFLTLSHNFTHDFLCSTHRTLFIR
ncbi:hypothetical protein HanPI659440_Chr16g0646481 [Helianthus annuus]|nr:hypothetical protein HanPI659440_Chr16g0646481 [Helianthus annuus]